MDVRIFLDTVTKEQIVMVRTKQGAQNWREVWRSTEAQAELAEAKAPKPRSIPSRKPRKIEDDKVLKALSRGPITAKAIGDKLRLARTDEQARACLQTVLRRFRDKRLVNTTGNPRAYRYSLAKDGMAALVENNAKQDAA